MTTLPDGITPSAPRRRGPVLFEQQWLDATFIHWAVAPHTVAPLFPPRTRPDVLAGRTFVGLIAFRMVGLGLGPKLPLPYLGRFPEINVRLYSVDEEGRHGVVFRSLEASRLISALAGRWGYRIPYTWARMTVKQESENRWEYRSSRRLPMPEVRTRIAVEVGERIKPTPVDHFVTARWGLHSFVAGRTLWTPNEHEPWPLRQARLVHLEDSLVPAAGIPVGGTPSLPALWSPGVRTRFGFPKPVARP